MKEVTPYLVFDGNCRDAMNFYQSCLGGELSVMRMGDGDFEVPPGAEDRLIHAHLASGPTVLMASDTMPGMPYTAGNSVSLNLVLDSVEEVDRLYGALGEGGQRTMAPHDSFWGARFAMLTDRFGINWMLNFDQKGAQAS